MIVQRILAGVAGVIMLSLTLAHAQQNARQIPRVEIPKDLLVYTKPAVLVATGNEIIEVLKTAKFAERNLGENTPDSCKAERIGEIHRGLMLFQLIYYFAVSKLENGYMNADFCCDRAAALKRPDRIALLSILQPTFIAEVLKLRQRMTELPDPVRRSLVTFLEELKQYHTYYGYMQRSQGRLDEIFARMADNYPSVSQLLDASESVLFIRKDKESLPLKKIREYFNFKSLPAWEAADDLRRLANSNRGFWGSKVSKCLDGSNENVAVRLGSSDPVSKDLNTRPTVYMTRFWRRRELEGTSSIALFIIDQAVNALQAGQ